MPRTYQTQWPVCPHCGHQHTDAWEWRHDDDYVDCESCGQEFAYSREIDVHYTTNIPDSTSEERRTAEKARVAELRRRMEEVRRERA